MNAVRSGLLVLPVVFGATFLACGSSGSGTRAGFDPTIPGDGTGDGTTPGGGFVTGDAGSSANGDGCSDEARLVYVLSLEGDLYSFAPAQKAFKKIAALNCGVTGFDPISMAVDRNAIAWVNMRKPGLLDDENRVFKVDVKTGACSPTEIGGVRMGGMAFSVNGPNSKEETLFVTGGEGALRKVDFPRNRIAPAVDLDGNYDPELTGTGDGRLYGYLQKGHHELGEINKQTGVVSKRVALTKRPTPWRKCTHFLSGAVTSTSTRPQATRPTSRPPSRGTGPPTEASTPRI
jgi:hypothetical protein